MKLKSSSILKRHLNENPDILTSNESKFDTPMLAVLGQTRGSHLLISISGHYLHLQRFDICCRVEIPSDWNDGGSWEASLDSAPEEIQGIVDGLLESKEHPYHRTMDWEAHKGMTGAWGDTAVQGSCIHPERILRRSQQQYRFPRSNEA